MRASRHSVTLKIKVPKRVYAYLKRAENVYQREFMEYKKAGGPLSTPFQKKLALFSVCSGVVAGGYLFGKNAPSCTREPEIVFGMIFGGLGGLLGSAFWPALPAVPILYATYKLIDIATRQ